MNLSRKKDVDVKYAGKWVFYFVLIGVMSGLGAILFHYLCGLGMHYFMDMMAGYRLEGSAGEHLLLPHTDTPFNKWVLLFLPAFGRHYPGTDSNYQNHCLHHHTDHGRLSGQGRPHCPDRGDSVLSWPPGSTCPNGNGAS